MERSFSLIKNEMGHQEKRVLPRFPFCYLTFKAVGQGDHVFEVRDISKTGMQLSRKEIDFTFSAGDIIKGSIHWLGNGVINEVSCHVKWVTDNRTGVEFNLTSEIEDLINNFLSPEQLVKALKPLHQHKITGLEYPSNLKYWLRADGPSEFFVWEHNDGEISHFQILLFDSFVEWEDGHGVSTGRIISKRDLDTPLITEDEFLFQMDDDGADAVKLDFALSVVSLFGPDLLDPDVVQFIQRKLSH